MNPEQEYFDWFASTEALDVKDDFLALLSPAFMALAAEVARNKGSMHPKYNVPLIRAEDAATVSLHFAKKLKLDRFLLDKAQQDADPA